MFKRTWMLCCLALWVFSAAALADVTGSFDFHITLIPEGTQTEAVKQQLDLQSNLVVNVTVSGMTLGVDIGFGTTGIEFAILSLTTNLGALTVFDEFVFATPFYNSSASDPILGSEIHPTTNSAGQVNGLTFVKKRIQLAVNIAGVNFTNLAIFEDVDFPNPFTYVNTVYNPGGFDDPTDNGTGLINQTPSFGFGDIITLEGQTVSGINLTSTTGICARFEDNIIKKRSWPESVNAACGSKTFGDETKSLILFDFQSLSLSGISVGGVNIDGEVVLRPNHPAQGRTQVGFNVLDLADVVSDFRFDDMTTLNLSQIQVDIVSGNLNASLFDFNGDLKADLLTASFNVILNPNQNPASLTILMVDVAQEGWVYVKPILTIERGSLVYSTGTVFDSGFNGPADLSWRFTEFRFSGEFGDTSFNAQLIYQPSGMLQGNLEFGVVF